MSIQLSHKNIYKEAQLKCNKPVKGRQGGPVIKTNMFKGEWSPAHLEIILIILANILIQSIQINDQSKIDTVSAKFPYHLHEYKNAMFVQKFFAHSGIHCIH